MATYAGFPVKSHAKNVGIGVIKFITNSTSTPDPDDTDDWDSGIVDADVGITRAAVGEFTVPLNGPFADICVVCGVVANSLYRAGEGDNGDNNSIDVFVFDNLGAPVDTTDVIVVIHYAVRY